MIAQLRRVLTLGALVCLASSALSAQVTPPPTPPVQPPVTQPPVVTPTRPSPLDTAKKPTAGGIGVAFDTVRRNGKLDSVPRLGRDKVLFEWEAPDSTMQEMDKRAGYRKVQYQGDSIRFNAKTGLLQLEGRPSAVKRDETVLIGPSIVYNDSAKIVQARAGPGDSVTLRDPSQRNADDFVVKGSINYDLGTRSASVGSFETSVEAGADRLYLQAKGGELFSDTLVSGKHIVWANDGSFTYCDLLEPHFHFTTKHMKFVSDNIMVARPGVLYIGEVPIFWIPFFFQDVRKGRRSGLLTPSFGIAELLRNSPSYRRQVSNMGYYFSINDYVGAEMSFDWRSGANGVQGDPGFVRANLETSYRWINRFISGRFSAEQVFRNDGDRNLSITWSHNQDFSKQTRLTSNINWVQDTRIQRQTTFNPIAATATILSQLNYQTKFGPTSINVGGTRRQYPGRSQVETDFPQLSVTSKPLSIAGGAFTWTPNANIRISTRTGLDQGVPFPFLFTPNALGGKDSSRINASSRTMNASFDSPISIFGYNLQNSFSLTEDVHNYPEEFQVINVNNPADSTRRVFAKTFKTEFNWDPRFTLPAFLRSTFAIAPSLNFNNVEGGSGFMVRTERSGGRWVGQPKRPTIGLSSSPTLYAILPGFGPVQAFRHKISPTFAYGYSPAASVSDDFLEALGRVRRGYLGALASNKVSMGLSTDIEAKLKVRNDTNPDAVGKKINLLSLNFSSLSWDFIRADTASTGLSETNFSISGRSDLLPGMDFRTNFSIFQGDPLSDTSYVSLFRTDLGATFSLNSKSPIFGVIGRLFGLRGKSLDDGSAPGTRQPTVAQDVIANQRSQSQAAGSSRRGSGVAIPQGQGWSLNLQYNAARQRPPTGVTAYQNDPTVACENQGFPRGSYAFDQCVLDANTTPPADGNGTNSRPGTIPFLPPPTQNVNANLTFNITPNWGAQWTTSYDIVQKRFATQQVGLQRQLHDWTTTFSFTQSPNGAFSFAFFIALKAQPSLKFDYNRATYRATGAN